MNLNNENINENNFNSKDVEDAFIIYKNKAAKIIESDSKTARILDKAEKMCAKLYNIPIIGMYIADIPVICHMISDYVKGNYRDVPLASIITLTAAIAYLVSPIDLIPDFIPGIGYLDDAFVINLALQAVHGDLMSYSEWKSLQNDDVIASKEF